MSALLKWCVFCVVTGREPRLDLDTRRYFEIGDREDLSYAEKLAAYRALADDVLRGRPLPRLLRQPARATSTSSCSTGSARPTSTGCSSTPSARPTRAHEHERFLGHFRGLIGQWIRERGATATLS